MAQSSGYYVGFWNDNDIEVGDVERVDTDKDEAIVHVELRWNGSTTAEINQFTLRPDEAATYSSQASALSATTERPVSSGGITWTEPFGRCRAAACGCGSKTRVGRQIAD
jgi:hypothetical protein